MDIKRAMMALGLTAAITTGTATARGGGGGGGHSYGGGSYGSRSYGGYGSGSSHSSGITRAIINGRPSGIGRIRASNGSFRNVRTNDGSRLVVRQGGRTEIDGVSWKAAPARIVSPQTVAGRRTIYWRPTTRIVQHGTPMVLASGPRVVPRPVYYRSPRDVYRSSDTLWFGCAMRPWDPFCRPFGFGYGYGMPYGYGYPFGFGWGYGAGSNANANSNQPDATDTSFGTWADPAGSAALFPTPTPEPDSTPEALPNATAVLACQYNDDAGNRVTARVRSEALGRCPSTENPPRDMRFPEPVAFCVYHDGNDSESSEITVPVAAQNCDLASPPTPTPMDLIDDDTGDDDGSQ